MRFLADECCDIAAVRTLRADGHDVLAIAEFMQQSVDSELLALALAEQRILLTEDKDFGSLVFAGGNQSPGVVLLRLNSNARPLIGPSISALVREHGPQLAGAFTVLQPGIARITPPATKTVT
jgi:predicted nuclease of predicted toxin-antitoxin system